MSRLANQAPSSPAGRLHARDWNEAWEWSLIVGVSLVAAIFGVLSADSMTATVHHDDGIYVATAKALYEGRGYSLINVPGEPAQTKYPPAYPLLLSLLWRLQPEFPANLTLLKAVNAVLIGLIAVSYGCWLRLQPVLQRADRLLAVSLLGTAPTILAYSNLILSEPLFILLILVGLVLCQRLRHGGSLPLAGLLGAVVGAAFLTRVVGLALAIVAVGLIWRANRRAAVITAVCAAVTVGAWALWVVAMRGDVGPLLNYYVTYEPSLHTLISTPKVLVALTTNNVAVLLKSAHRMFGGHVVGALSLVVVSIGAVISFRRHLAGRADVAFVAVYSAIVLDHPMPMSRYVLPVIPFAAFWLVIGARALRAYVGPAVWVLVAVVLFTQCAVNAARIVCAADWGARCKEVASMHQSFRDTAKWLREHTDRDAVIASSHDTLYYLYTGRRAVRPWKHDAHYYVVGRHLFGQLSTSALATELERLGVQCLVLGPYWAGGEGNYARQQMEALLTSDPRWRLKFESELELQKVYCLQRSTSVGP